MPTFDFLRGGVKSMEDALATIITHMSTPRSAMTIALVNKYLLEVFRQYIDRLREAVTDFGFITLSSYATHLNKMIDGNCPPQWRTPDAINHARRFLGTTAWCPYCGMLAHDHLCDDIDWIRPETFGQD